MRPSIGPRSIFSTVAFFAISLPQASQATYLDPISVPFGPDFIGYDGLWSPAQIRVGSPEQYLLVFPSTTSSETWVAGPALCTDPTCASRRGGIFYSANSSTYRSLGQFELGYSALTETTQDAAYGFDNISISDSITATSQIVAIVDNVQQWNGALGMGVVETRFINNTNHLPFLSTLVQNNSIIPSHSYGYTAGASYQGSGVAGSLTLGGADSSRYTQNNFWFTLAPGYIPSVALKSLQLSAISHETNWTTNPLALLPPNQVAMFTIDSSTPFLWLPEDVCDSIAQALSLSWNPDLELYVLDSGTAQDRVDMGLTFSFNLATAVDSNEILSLKVSYDAFNLQLSYPFPGLSNTYSEDKLAYFPMRRANNSLQYTIGRAFLQEIYLIVDYESNRFSLSQALFPDSSQSTEIVGISRPWDSTWPGPVGTITPTGLSTGVKAGIAVAIVVLVVVTAVLAWFYFKRKNRKHSQTNNEKVHKNSIFSLFSKRSTRRSSVSTAAAELNADKVHPSEMGSDASTSRFELSGTTPIEMAAAEVAPTFFQERSNAIITQRNDPRLPIELVSPPSRGSVSKTDVQVSKTDVQVSKTGLRPYPAASAYSPAEINQRYSNTNSSSGNGVSPFSTRRSGELYNNGSDHLISPVTGNGSDRNRFSHGNLSQAGSASSKHLSPISPVKARGEGSLSPQLPNHQRRPGPSPEGTNQAARNTLSPIPDRSSIPRRSPSRDSRFREELTEDVERQSRTEQSQNSRPTLTETRRSSRFSWEG